MDSSQIRLTQTVKKGGCAAKLPAGSLRQVLKTIERERPPELLVGTNTFDDASLWDLGDGRLLVQTLDFFTPIVDDPYAFGQIAAANALSDVFAMGALPKTAQTILAFPTQTLPLELLEPLLEGALERIAAAGAFLTGGHSIDDETLKLGFCVSGFVAKGKAWTNAGAKPGDVLILTKALGTGTITSGLKLGKASEAIVNGAITSMIRLNDAVLTLAGLEVHAATDVTGFGLGGHAYNLALASDVSLEIDTARLPVLEGAMELLRDGVLNRAHHTNKAYIEETAVYATDLPERRWLVCDPQTSGGLLLAIPEKDVDKAVTSLRGRFPCTAIIGTVSEAAAMRLRFR